MIWAGGPFSKGRDLFEHRIGKPTDVQNILTRLRLGGAIRRDVDADQFGLRVATCLLYTSDAADD